MVWWPRSRGFTEAGADRNELLERPDSLLRVLPFRLNAGEN